MDRAKPKIGRMPHAPDERAARNGVEWGRRPESEAQSSANELARSVSAAQADEPANGVGAVLAWLSDDR